MKKRIATLVLAGLFCICLAGCASENAWKTDTLNKISYSAPQNWEAQEGGNFRNYSGVDGSALLVTALTDTPPDLETAYERFTASMSDKAEVERHEVTIAERRGVSYIVQHKSDKTALKSELTFFQVEEVIYVIALTCPEKSFSQYEEIYRTIIESARLTDEVQQ